jgi:NAD(P)-dependent dehydrogenase (short-subunit alcohol dehydrogenase family)
MSLDWPNLRYDYAGAAVLVTGGTSGIGAAIASAYHAAGADVTITGTRAGPDDYEADLSGLHYIRLDIEKDEDVARVAHELQRLDILVNNGGVAFASLGLDEYDPELFDRAVRMHLTGVYRLTHGCTEMLAESLLPGGGSMIGISSLSAYLAVEPVPGYGAAKAGLIQLVKTLAIHLAPRNIRVNAVAPGHTVTRMTAALETMPETAAPVVARTPLRRLGRPEDIAGAVLFLTSAGAGFITGQTLPIDGGYGVVG